MLRTVSLAAMVMVFTGGVLAQDVLVDSQGTTLRKIGPQRFEMGSREPVQFRKDHPDFNPGDDRPIHPVVLTQPFFIATTEVTRGQFAAFIDATGYRPSATRNDRGMVGWDPIDHEDGDRVKQSFSEDERFSWLQPGFDQTDLHPVVGVSFQDAQAYCRWLSETESATYRLPTEAEWECVSRAGTDGPFCFGDDYRTEIQRYANIGHAELERAFRHRVLMQWLVDVKAEKGDGFVHTAAVGSLQPNDWGVHDMHGNVWEWCQDRYVDTWYEQYKRPGHREVRPRAIDPKCDVRWNDAGDWRVIRGGSWFNSPIQCRSGVRGYFGADDAACYLGFRVVRECEEAERTTAATHFAKSQEALEQLTELADKVYEATDGHLRLEFICEDVTADQLSAFALVQDSVEVDLRPPGQLTNELIEAVCSAQRLAGVTFRSGGKGLTGDSYASLASHPELMNVQITGVGDLDDGVLTHLAPASSLVSLHVQGKGITDQGIAQLKPSTTMRYLSLGDTLADGGCLSTFEGSALEQLTAANLSDSGARLLPKFPSLGTLRLRKSPITDAAIESIVQLRRLKDLDLSDCRELTDEAMARIGELRQLTRVTATGSAFGDLTAAAIEPLHSLTALRLSSIQLTDQGLDSLADLVGLQELTIDAETPHITDRGFASFWRLVNLRELNLRSDSLTGSGMRFVTELPKLEKLDLCSIKLSDAVFESIAGSGSLEQLTIGYWNRDPSKSVSPEGLRKLCQSDSLKQVTLIGYGELISEQDLDELRSANESLKWSMR